MEYPVTLLNRLDSCAVSDALDKLGLPGAVTSIHRLSTDRRIAGRVLTVKLGIAEGPNTATRHLSTAAIEEAMPGEIIVVEQRTGIDAAAWGGVLSRGAKLRSVAGVICDGPARDLDESRQLDFPVFARDHTCRTARGRIVEVGTNVPITVGDVAVSPGDYVIADGSAVVFIAQRDLARVLDAAEFVARREAAMVAALEAGQRISEVMGANYEHMLESHAK
ncbi:MAG: RraA family protein [Acidobacteriia bacterium]|nr:RraA family protein [Terriglobia bacterium]